jgi:Spy/CpxP family protein refolding chaperone
MKNRWIAMILVLSLAMNTAALAVGGYNWYCGRHLSSTALHSPDKREHHFYEVLGLTPDQLAKVTPMAATFHESLKSLQSEMGEKKEAMINLLEGEGAPPTRIEALRMEMAAIQDGIQKTVIAHVLDVKEILDAGQQERFFDLLRRSMAQERGMFVRTGE